MRSGPEGQAAECALCAVSRGDGDADFDKAGKVPGHERATGLRGGAAPALHRLSTVYSVCGVFPEGQGVGRADAPARTVRKVPRLGVI